jgi:MFS transporter, ACS family, D-galactonate transporter
MRLILTTPRRAPVPRRRWWMALLLAFGVVIAYFDRINLSISREALHTSFGLSLVSFGYLSSAFSWTYAVMQVPSGVLLDRFGIRRVGLVGAFLWSVASFLASLSPGLGLLFGARLLLGLAEAPIFPATAKATGVWFRRSERSLAVSLTDAAAKFSSAIGVPFLGLVMLHFGWRWTFATTGVLSLVYFALFLCFYRNPREDRGLSRGELDYITEGGAESGNDAEVIDTSWSGSLARLSYLLVQPKVYGLALGWGAYNYSFFLLLTWLPTYLSTVHHMDLFHSAMYTAAPWLFATLTDIAIGGWLVDTLIERGWNANRVRKSVLVIGTSFGLCIFGAVHPHSAAGALFWISLALGGLAASCPVAWSVPSLIAPRNSVGSMASIANLSSQLAGISAPIATGYIVSATHSFASAFITAAVILLIGIFGYGILLGPIEPIPESAE